jgi:N-acylneuraminate cytidylyltransferase
MEPTVTALETRFECIEVDVENIILLQCTNPLRPDNLLKEALKYIKEPSDSSIYCYEKS